LKDASSQLATSDVKALNELIYDNWGTQKIAAKDWQGAAQIYAAGLAVTGPSEHLHNNVVYLAQEWARASFANGGIEATIQMSRQIDAVFPELPGVRQGPAAIIRRAVIDRAEARDFEAAIALAERGGEILPVNQANDLVEFGYDRWAKFFMKDKQWQEALKIYDKGLSRLPDSGLLTQNRAHCLAQLE
jgi:tetratricopeptide (TPR) repeat protein